MYESPITITERLVNKTREQMENDIMSNILTVATEYDINVNRDELIKALQYEREQYNKGYVDGMKEFAKRLDKWLRDDVTLFTQQRYIMEGAIEKTYLEMVGDY